ncbi:MAG: carbamoyl phosphate synthase small subunit, partial [Ilumatobacteraceae bacterium]
VSDILKPLHINQDLARYELHRVWVVEAKLKPGTSHLYSRRTFLIDEDSWQILAADQYDGRGQLWRVSEAHCINYYDAQAFWSTLEVHVDLQNGRYLAVGLDNENKMYDFGIKRTILSCLSEIADVHVVPWRTPAAEVIARKPDGVFLSNGPGDPEMVIDAPGNVRDIIAAGIPLFGICLGHQLLGLALGGRTFKLPYGHHGANHPVRDVVTGKVEITSQNHNFCIDPDSVAHQVSVTHVNLNDQTNEGMSVRGARAFSVQYHPEAGPGPHDSRYLFDRFADLMRSADS